MWNADDEWGNLYIDGLVLTHSARYEDWIAHRSIHDCRIHAAGGWTDGNWIAHGGFDGHAVAAWVRHGSCGRQQSTLAVDREQSGHWNATGAFPGNNRAFQCRLGNLWNDDSAGRNMPGAGGLYAHLRREPERYGDDCNNEPW